MLLFNIQNNNFVGGSLIVGFRNYLSAYNWSDHFLVFLDILAVAVLIYYLFLLVKGTRATRIIIGLGFLMFILILGRWLQLKTLSWVLKYFMAMVAIAIPVVFQPELRRALEYLGRTRFLGRYGLSSSRQTIQIIEEVVKASKVMAEKKVGGLIVFKRQTGLDDYIETGIKLDARVSLELLLNIFFPKSPLHDGAVIIKGERIAAASCLLPLAEGEQTYTYGTRHRAALGLSENSDAIIVVISEERGIISLIYDGKIKENIVDKELKKELIKLLS